MTEENPIQHGKGMIQELRARQKWHGHQEIELAREIQRHIRAQSELEDQIIAWHIHLDLVQKEKAIESETAWDKLRKKLAL